MNRISPRDSSNNKQGGTRGDDEPIPPGEYLIALVWFKRQYSRDKTEYLNCCFQVCHGPKMGSKFFCPWWLDTSKDGTLTRWQLWMEAVGCSDEFDLDDDRHIEKHFKGKGFKCEVRQQSGQYPGNDLGRLTYKRLWTSDDIVAIDAWNDNWNQKNGWQGQSPDSQPSGQHAPAQKTSEPQWSENSPFGADDSDIPF